MSHETTDPHRYAASVAVFAGALATAALYVLSDYVAIERTVVVASVPALVVGLVAAAAVVFWRAS